MADVRPVHVAIHAALDPRSAGGVQTNLLSLVHGLGQAGSAAKVTLLAPASIVEPWRALADPNTDVTPWAHVFPWYRETSTKALRQKLAEAIAGIMKPGSVERDRELRATGAQLVHFPYQLAFDTALPSIYEPWDLQHIHLPHLFSPGERQWRTAMYRRACQRAALVVTATATTKRDIVETFGVPPDKIAVILRDSDIMQTPPPAERRIEVLRELGIEGEFAFYPAMTFPHKNHVALFEALSIVRAKHGLTIKLVCSGRVSQAHQATIEESLRHHRIEAQVKFVGALPEEALVSLFAEAKMLAFPSLFEGLGLPLLEAMQFGVPIVASATSCIPEVTADAAVLFNPKDPEDMASCLTRVWTDEALRHEMRSKGQIRRRDFAWDKAAPTFVAAYRKVAGLPLTQPQQDHLSQALA
ncbi:glycosyltransferase family 1 protein [Bosea sp. AAP35]|uniref:glycosyltransferase family 4 protein n=1 Tax=Bosea sp. AAP35 TaxID=1523417 RepID=UPI0006B8E4FA|nr:glycosyltransferase family 1 protein [Bosea sp. AAP35]